MNLTDLWRECSCLEEAAIPFVLVTLVSKRGDAPQIPGAKAVVSAEGLRAGTVGGGKLEAAAIRHAQELLKSERSPVTVTWNLQRDLGMSCGGEATLLFEPRDGGQPWRVVVFGAGHVAQAVARVLQPLGCLATFVDWRAEWIEKLPTHSRLEKVLLGTPEDLVSYVDRLRGSEFVVAMTQGHATDLPVLTAVLKAYPGLPYVGAIGSPIKAMKLRKELVAAGVAASAVDRLICPIGGWLGRGETEEIAVCTVAELIRIRDQACPSSK